MGVVHYQGDPGFVLWAAPHRVGKEVRSAGILGLLIKHTRDSLSMYVVDHSHIYNICLETPHGCFPPPPGTKYYWPSISHYVRWYLWMVERYVGFVRNDGGEASKTESCTFCYMSHFLLVTNALYWCRNWLLVKSSKLKWGRKWRNEDILNPKGILEVEVWVQWPEEQR